MKRISILIVICQLAANCIAQDVIITLESKRIEAKVTEITDWQVFYQLRTDSLINIIELSRVASIIFENGEVFVPQPQHVPEHSPKQQNENVWKNSTFEDDNYEELSISLPSGQTVVLRSGMQLTSVYGKNQYGLFEFKNAEDYLFFLKEICNEAYKEEIKSKKLNKIAWPGLTVSTVLLGVGLYYAVDANLNESNSSKNKMSIWVGSGIGVFLVSICIGLSASEHSKNAQAIFNQLCAPFPRKSQDVSFSLNLAPTGAGLTLSF